MTAAGKMVTALRSDDDFADRLNFRYTTAMLVTFSILITSKQYVGQPIQCWTPEHFSKTHIQYAKDFCWIRNTYFLPYQSDIPREGQVCTTLMLHGSFTFNRVCIPRPWTRFIILSPATANELVFLITFVCYPPYVRKEGYIGLLVGVLQSMWASVACTDRREILRDGAYRSRTDLLPFKGEVPQGKPQIRNFGPKFWPCDREYLENGKSQRYMSIRA